MAGFESCVEDLENVGHTSIPGLSERERRALFSTFANLIEFDTDALRATRLDETGRGYGRGGFREVPGEIKDGQPFAVNKHSFLYDPAFESTWREQKLGHDISEFIELCGQAYHVGMASFSGIARALAQRPQYAGYDRRALGDEPSARLAVMRYDIPYANDASRSLFGSHRDTSLMSAHLGDTHRGFYFADTDRSQHPHDLEDGEGVLFVGKQWDQMYPDSPIKAPFHGVSLPEGVGDIQRSSAVLFLDKPGYSTTPQERGVQ